MQLFRCINYYGRAVLIDSFDVTFIYPFDVDEIGPIDRGGGPILGMFLLYRLLCQPISNVSEMFCIPGYGR